MRTLLGLVRGGKVSVLKVGLGLGLVLELIGLGLIMSGLVNIPSSQV